ncbi:MAG: phosphodiester glycosidase family protein [Solirubrobacterales bacterium]|nr:phosphodiester glycosidase family protein [Solirubrobacterales bacterium]
MATTSPPRSSRLRLPSPRRRRLPRRRIRRAATIAALLCLVPALISYAGALTERSDTSVGIRTVEWLRDNGARSLVNRVENLYYTLTAPAKGGPALRALPHQAGAEPAGTGPAARARSAAGGEPRARVHRRRVSHAYRPRRIRPVIRPALPGEGVWRPTFAGASGSPPVLITSYRPEPAYPQLVAGVAWIDTHRTSVSLYPGSVEPAVDLPSRGPMEVPPNKRSRLVATFNSGFKLSDSGGGFAAGGHTYAPLESGVATIVRHRNGRINIDAWRGPATAPRGIVFARQNLPLIVDHGQLNPNLSDGPEWGATLGNAVLVWRSGVGIDRHGDLIYAAANDQTVSSLAQILQRAGAVRAMELDINAEWTSFITYRHRGARQPANLLADMDRSPLRYLTPDDRDFFAVYLR